MRAIASVASATMCGPAAMLLRSLLVTLALLANEPGARGQAPTVTDSSLSSSTTDAGSSDTDASDRSTITSVSTSVSVSVSTAIATTTTTDSTRVVSLFYLDERAFEGLPYTLLHRVCGEVLAVDDTATTYVITTTRTDMRSTPTLTRTDNITTGIPTLRPPSYAMNATGPPSTITQGPATFMFTGTRFGDANRTIVNHCSLNGTNSARCNLTHVGPIWYTSDANWNGTFSTYNYNWTSGDRYGFAPCTVTSGVERMGPPTLTATTSSNGAPALRRRPGTGAGADEVFGLLGSAFFMGAFIVGIFVVL